MLVRDTRAGRGRSGITLTEILISIMIMGIGIISLATLFPLGLIRLRNAQRLARSGYLVESAAADLGSRNLLSKNSFLNTFISPWYVTAGAGRYDPWIQDTPAYQSDWYDTASGAPLGAFAGGGGAAAAFPALYRPGPGLPVAYDPLWRAVTDVYIGTPAAAASEARFGSGIGVLPNDPNPGGASSLPSAHGLQRVTNLIARTPINAPTASPVVWQNYSTVIQTFVSPEDFILQDPKGQPTDSNGLSVVNPSPLVPDLSNKSPENDWRFTWMFTGQQSDSSNGFVFDGDIVVHENRQFAIDPATATAPATVAGERVVEALWGYSTTQPTAAAVGYSNTANRSVLLRWSASLPDPDVRVGGWIADVTYERVNAEDVARRTLPGPLIAPFPLQRCYWYQVTKKTEAVPSAGGTTREINVYVSTPLRAKTPINFSTGAAYHVEAALIVPSVVNVFPRTVYSR